MHNLLFGMAALALIAAPNTDLADCGTVREQYNASVAAVVKALRGYATCVGQSDMKRNCEAQMQALDDAHDNFTDAVADAKDCK